MKNTSQKGAVAVVVIIIVLAIAVLAYIMLRPNNKAQSPAMPDMSSQNNGAVSPLKENDKSGPTGSVELNISTPKIIDIANFAFSIPNLSVKKGETVRFVNHDTIPHTITSDTGAFESGNIAPNAEFSKTFSTVGTFSYHCSYHPSMKGSITVTE